jgi:inner membrane protein
MIEWLTDISAWHWSALGIGMLVLEALGVGGFLIGAALSAFTTALSLVFFPELGWKIQLTMFSSLSVVFTLVYWVKFRNFNEKTDQPTLNDRASQFVGKHYTLQEGTKNREGKLKIGDTLWKIRSDKDLLTGTEVEVINTEGMTFLVKACE